MEYVYLGLAIIAEVIAANALKASGGLTKLWPSVIMCVSYALTFYFMTMALRTIPLGVTYAIWSGVGIVLITLTSVFFFNEKVDMPAIIGMGLIIAGVIVINVFSKIVPH
ncbi:SMR family transporter [Thiolinea disciformis]|uniref:SMR family transporter n=1 Tax=Thiolinea disciformis TaxID=125614 RepID=UPI0003793C0C|nr:SMR family transporter [Thiolinea disciformis]